MTKPANGFTSGVITITSAKLWFLVTGYVIYFGLGRLLGPERFGLYAVVISVVSVFNNVLIAASLQTVSRFVAHEPARAGAVLARARRLLVVVGGSLCAGLFLAAPRIAEFFRDPAIVLPLRIASSIVFAYAVYAVHVGYLNGMRRFPRQAGLDAGYSTLKAVFVLGAVVLGLGVVGAVAGFALAAFAVLAISAVVVRGEANAGEPVPWRRLAAFGSWLIGLTVLANLVLSVDLWLVKRLADAAVANREAGLYRASLSLSQLIYQLLLPATLVVFPTVARLSRDADPAAVARVLRTGVRYVLLLSLPGAAVLAACGGDVVALLYGEDYRAAGAWLSFQAPAYALFTAAYLQAMALTGAGHPRLGIAFLGAGLVVQTAAGALLFASLGVPGIALADVLGMGFAFAGLTLAAGRRFGAFFPAASAARAVVVAVALGALAMWWPAAGAWLLLKLAVLALTGGALLLALGERPPQRGSSAERVAA